MKIEHIHTHEVTEIPYHDWGNFADQKQLYNIVDYGDLVYWQNWDSNGQLQDLEILDRNHVLQVNQTRRAKHTLRELTTAEWMQIYRRDEKVCHKVNPLKKRWRSLQRRFKELLLIGSLITAVLIIIYNANHLNNYYTYTLLPRYSFTIPNPSEEPIKIQRCNSFSLLISGDDDCNSEEIIGNYKFLSSNNNDLGEEEYVEVPPKSESSFNVQLLNIQDLKNIEDWENTSLFITVNVFQDSYKWQFKATQE